MMKTTINVKGTVITITDEEVIITEETRKPEWWECEGYMTDPTKVKWGERL